MLLRPPDHVPAQHIATLETVYQHGDNPEAKLTIPDEDFTVDAAEDLTERMEVTYPYRMVIHPGRTTKGTLAFIRWLQRIHEYEGTL